MSHSSSTCRPAPSHVASAVLTPFTCALAPASRAEPSLDLSSVLLDTAACHLRRLQRPHDTGRATHGKTKGARGTLSSFSVRSDRSSSSMPCRPCFNTRGDLRAARPGTLKQSVATCARHAGARRARRTGGASTFGFLSVRGTRADGAGKEWPCNGTGFLSKLSVPCQLVLCIFICMLRVNMEFEGSENCFESSLVKCYLYSLQCPLPSWRAASRPRGRPASYRPLQSLIHPSRVD